MRLLLLVSLAVSALSLTSEGPLAADERVLFRDDFEGDLVGWDVNDDDAIRIVDSGDVVHGRVLEMRPEHSTLRALIDGSDTWPAYRMEGEVLFPTDEHNYLGFVYNLRDVDGRVDMGSLYIKGNGSYIRVNPRRDWNPARSLHEEFRVELTGKAAIVIGEWQRFALEVSGAECHLYVGDLTVPQVTFPFLELDAGRAGLKPRVVGGAVWVDNLRVTAIGELSYRGPILPAGLEHRPERMVRDWQVIGPFPQTVAEVEHRSVPAAGPVAFDGVEYSWRPFETDGRGAVVTGRVVDFLGPGSVAYFYTRIDQSEGGAGELQFSTIDDLTMWRNGHFEGYSYADRYAWYDFGVHPDHPPSPYTSLQLESGVNHVLIRVRGGRYASGGFYAAVAPSQ